jgi:hypothetical protein
VLVAGNEREGERIICELHCALAKLANKVPRPRWAFPRDIITDAAKIVASLVRESDLHNSPCSRAMPV